MKKYKKQSIKYYKETVGRSFTDDEIERDFRKIIKYAGKLGWRYCDSKLNGRSFCNTEGQKNDKEESASLDFVWRSSKR